MTKAELEATIHTLEQRLAAERRRSAALEVEVCRLRGSAELKRSDHSCADVQDAESGSPDPT